MLSRELPSFLPSCLFPPAFPSCCVCLFTSVEYAGCELVMAYYLRQQTTEVMIYKLLFSTL
jgi:hypothetical protein